MKKIKINKWNDFLNYSEIKDVITPEKLVLNCITFADTLFLLKIVHINDYHFPIISICLSDMKLEKIIKILNILGFNFEYVEEVE